MKIRVGHIIKTKSGVTHKIIKEFYSLPSSSAWHEDAVHYETDIGNILKIQIESIIGETCAKCGKDIIYNNGYYTYARGENQCVKCSELPALHA